MLTRRLSLLRIPALLALATLTVAGCRLPRFPGAQIQNPPRRFLLQNDSYQPRRMFPDLQVTRHIAWIEAANGPYSGIYINAHPGNLTIEDVAAAQDAARSAAEHPATWFGEIEPLQIDGRTAWGWPERLETPELGLDWVAYRTVVSYDTVSYAIEFYGGDPVIKLHAPDTLKTVIASFAIGETTWNLPLIALLVGAGLLGVSMLRNRTREKAARLQSINLVTIPKNGQEDGAVPASRAASAPDTAAASAAPPATPPPPAPPAAPSELRPSATGPEDGSAT